MILEQTMHSSSDYPPDDNQTHPSASGEPVAELYEIRVKGIYDPTFLADWFGGIEITADPQQAETVFRSRVADQPELYGLLSRLRNRGLHLISVQHLGGDTNTTQS